MKTPRPRRGRIVHIDTYNSDPGYRALVRARKVYAKVETKARRALAIITSDHTTLTLAAVVVAFLLMYRLLVHGDRLLEVMGWK